MPISLACCNWRSISGDARNWINAYKRLAPQTRQLEASVGRQDELAAMVQSIEAFCERVKQGLTEATFEQRRLLVELLIDRVIVTNEEVEIRYVIPIRSKLRRMTSRGSFRHHERQETLRFHERRSHRCRVYHSKQRFYSTS
jgi:hypothetical protein